MADFLPTSSPRTVRSVAWPIPHCRAGGFEQGLRGPPSRAATSAGPARRRRRGTRSGRAARGRVRLDERARPARASARSVRVPARRPHGRDRRAMGVHPHGYASIVPPTDFRAFGGCARNITLTANSSQLVFGRMFRNSPMNSACGTLRPRNPVLRSIGSGLAPNSMLGRPYSCATSRGLRTRGFPPRLTAPDDGRKTEPATPARLGGVRVPLRADRASSSCTRSTGPARRAVDGADGDWYARLARNELDARRDGQQPARRLRRDAAGDGRRHRRGAGPAPARRRRRARAAVAARRCGDPRGCSTCPIVIPEIVLGVALVSFFGLLGTRLSLGTVVLAHLAFSVSLRRDRREGAPRRHRPEPGGGRDRPGGRAGSARSSASRSR